MTGFSPYAAQLAEIPVNERVVAVDGAATHYWEYGDPAAATVIVVHGFRGDHHGLEPVVAQLPGLHIISPDLPGFGASEPLAGEHSIAGYSAWLRAFIDELALDAPPVVLGHSFGSIVVSAAVADGLAPERVILINPIASPALAGPRGLMTRLAVFYYWLANALPERLGFALLRNPAIVRVMSIVMAKTKDRALRRWIHAQHDQYFSAFANRRVVLEAFKASVGNHVAEFAESITVPTLLIAAERDDISSVPAQHRLAGLIDGSRLVVLPGVGHLVHYEAPQAAGAHVADFVAQS